MGAFTDERLATMPLHTITASLGEPGLRRRLSLQAAALDSGEGERLSTALGYAETLHRHDRRIGEPYLNHLLRVTIRIMSHYGVDDVDVAVAALLHDAVEDHAREIAGPDARGLAEAELAAAALRCLAVRFGQRVADLVAAVTNPAYLPGIDPDRQYREHLAASLAANPWARVIKISDFTDNGLGIVHISGPKAVRAATKYRPVVPILRELVSRPDTPLSQTARQRITNQLDLAEKRFDAVLSGGPGPGDRLAGHSTIDHQHGGN